jgi:hypothetical protein
MGCSGGGSGVGIVAAVGVGSVGVGAAVSGAIIVSVGSEVGRWVSITGVGLPPKLQASNTPTPKINHKNRYNFTIHLTFSSSQKVAKKNSNE